MERARLDQILLRLGLVDEARLRRALERQRERGGRLGTHLVEMGVLTADQLVLALSEQFGVPSVIPTENAVDQVLLEKLPPEFIAECAVLPLHLDSARGTLSLAVADPTDHDAIERACAILGATTAIPMIAPESMILELCARLLGRSRSPIELPELFDAAASGVITAIASESSDGTDLENVLMISAGAATKNFLPAVFVQEGWRLHVAGNREEFEQLTRDTRFEHVLVAQDMAEAFMSWMRESGGGGLGSSISVFPAVSAALLDNPAPYAKTARSVRISVQMLAEQRCQQFGVTVPYGLISRDVEELARQCGLRQLAIDGLDIALHFLLPGHPFADFSSSIDAARRLKFPWRIDAALTHCAELFEHDSAKGNPDQASGEHEIAAQILALCWHRHVELHVPDVPADDMVTNIKTGLRAQSGRLASVELVESYIRQISENGRTPGRDGERQVLVIGNSASTMQPLTNRLRRIGYRPVQAADPADGQAMIARRPPAAILFDHEFFEAEAANFCRVHGLNPESLLYVITANNDPVTTLSLLDAGADDVFAPPHDFDLCAARVDRALRARATQAETSTRVSGEIAANLGAFSFPELMQSLGHGLKSVRIKLVRGNGEIARIYMQEGRLVHASCAELTGEEAIYRVIAWQDDGEFVVVPEDQFPEPNIQLPLESILMEGCRILDETLA